MILSTCLCGVGSQSFCLRGWHARAGSYARVQARHRPCGTLPTRRSPPPRRPSICLTEGISGSTATTHRPQTQESRAARPSTPPRAQGPGRDWIELSPVSTTRGLHCGGGVVARRVHPAEQTQPGLLTPAVWVALTCRCQPSPSPGRPGRGVRSRPRRRGPPASCGQGNSDSSPSFMKRRRTPCP